MIEFLTHNKFILGLVSLIIILITLQIIGYITNRFLRIEKDWNRKHAGHIAIGLVTILILSFVIFFIYTLGDKITTLK